MQRETIRFHKGLRAVLLPDGRRLSTDQKRVFVEPPQSLQPSSGQHTQSGVPRPSGGSATQRATQGPMNVGTKTGQAVGPASNSVPVGPAATVGPHTKASADTPSSSSNATQKDSQATAEEVLRSLQDRIDPLLRRISTRMSEYVATQQVQIQQLEKPTLEIAMCIAEHVVGQCVDAKQLNMQPLITNALRHLTGPDEVQLKLNTHDLAALQSLEVDLKSFGTHVSIVADASLPAGSCIVENGWSPNGIHDSATARQCKAFCDGGIPAWSHLI